MSVFLFCLLVKGLNGSESSVLARQKELLLQKLETFEATNQTLRHLLRAQHGSQVTVTTLLDVLTDEEETWRSLDRVVFNI